MNTFSTFGNSDPQPSKELAAARIDGQDDFLDHLEGPIIDRAVAAVSDQEQQLRAVYRPYIVAAGDRVRDQQELLDRITSPLTLHAANRTGQTGGPLTTLVAAIPADMRSNVLDLMGEPDRPQNPFELRAEADALSAVTQAAEAATGATAPGEPTTPRPLDGQCPEPVCCPPQPAPVVNVTVHTDGQRPSTTTAIPTSPPAAVEPAASPAKSPTPAAPTVGAAVCPTESEWRALRQYARTDPTRPGYVSVPESVRRAAADRLTPADCPPDPATVADPRGAVSLPPATSAGGQWVTTDRGLCTTAEAYVASFAAVGGAVREFIYAPVKAVGAIAEALTKLKDVPRVGDFFRFVTVPAEVVARSMLSLDEVLFTNYRAWMGARAEALIGLYFTRGLLSSLSDASIGWNLVVQASVKLDVIPKQLIAIVDYLIEYLYPVKIAELGEVELLWHTRAVTDDQAACLAAMHGRQRDEFFRDAHAKRQRLTPDMEVKHWLRFRTPATEIQGRLREYGMTDPGERDRLIELNQFLPPPSDAIRFALRDVFDPNKLGRAEMLAELQQQPGLREMLAAIGIDKTRIRTAAGVDMVLDLPLLYWMTSYEEISPTQGFEMLHRLRPNRVGRLTVPGPAGQPIVPGPVTMREVQALLKEKDYNPIWRDRLAAISYRVPGRIDTRNMYKRGVFGPPRGVKGVNRANPANPVPVAPAEVELAERYRDQGYSEVDANSLALLDAVEYDRAAAKRNVGKTATLVCKAYGLGVYDYAGALAVLTREVGDPDTAKRILDECDLARAVRDLELAVNGVKKQFIGGGLSSDQARTTLLGFGVHAARADKMIGTWRLYRTAKSREVAASELGEWFRQGMLSQGEFGARLVNLGYTADDARQVVRRAVLGELAKSTKEKDKLLKAQERERERIARQRKAELKEQEKAQERRLTRFLAGRSEKNLKEWLAAGEITAVEVAATFAARGWNPEDISRWLAVNNPGAKG